jgi:UDP-glucose 4-epimerase
LSQAEHAAGLHGIDLRAPGRLQHHTADIRSREAVEMLAPRIGEAPTVIHLAASAEVLIPWRDVGGLVSNNLDGTYNLLDTLKPGRVVFASSSSVYGDAGVEQTGPAAKLDPLSLYAMSKMGGEMLIREWAGESGSAGVILRFGNVIGSGCRGLIPHLVEHALRYPKAERPVRLRGRGSLIRDYVPAAYVARVLIASTRLGLDPGTTIALNVGTGRGTSNREVAEFVRDLLVDDGLRLDVMYDDEPGPGESKIVVLDMAATVELTGLEPPGVEDVRASIQESVRVHLAAQCVS